MIRRRQIFYQRFPVWIGVFLLLFTASCGPREPIRIGYIAGLTGPMSDLGVAGREGASLAVEDLNKAGGIQGRQVELLVYNDELEASQTLASIDDSRRQGAVAAVGFMTSAEAVSVLDYANQNQFLVISPTATSTNFSHQDDYFLRVLPDTDALGAALGSWIAQSGVSRLAGVFEEGNRAYAENLLLAAQKSFEAEGGKMDTILSYRTGEGDLNALAARINGAAAEAVLFSSPAADTALLAQYLRAFNNELRFFAVPWSQTRELLEKGGKAINGMELLALYHPQNPAPSFQSFARRYQERYKRNPEFGAAYAYEAVMVLADALTSAGGKKQGLREAVLEKELFSGVQGEIAFDQNGDCQRPLYIARVVDQQYIVINTLPLEAP